MGGPPCIGHSTMGLKQGFDHSETKLFFELVKIVASSKPRVVILENTPSILKREQFAQVCKVFDSIGYDLCWSLVYAFEVGAPHNRRRWFCIAHNRYKDAGAVLNQLRRSLLARKESYTFAHWRKEPVPRMTAKKQVAFTKRSALLGNAVVPQQLRLAIFRI